MYINTYHVGEQSLMGNSMPSVCLECHALIDNDLSHVEITPFCHRQDSNNNIH